MIEWKIKIVNMYWYFCIFHFLDFTGKYKWDAWKKNEGLSQDDAKSQYVAALIAILEKHSDQDDAKQWLSQLKD